MRVKHTNPILPSRDLCGSLSFYVDGLLFERISEYPYMITVAFDAFHLSFVHPEDASFSSSPSSRYFAVSLEITGIADYFAKIKKVGKVKFHQELDFHPGEFWQFSVIDNNGYRIGFNEHA
jgi:hypothetical protein